VGYQVGDQLGDVCWIMVMVGERIYIDLVGVVIVVIDRV
jgi:hypothetical protein